MAKNTRILKNDFAVFILTHGRPNNVVTTKTLRHQGYTGKIYYIVDNEDKTVNDYVKNFGKKNVIIFDKKVYADQVDEGNNFDERRTITHARNASFDIAEKLGIKYFMQLDDDYYTFQYRINKNGRYARGMILIRTKFDQIIESLLKFYIATPAKSIAISQGGDWIGGSEGGGKNYPLKRKAMNSFICSTDRRFQFIGAMNEDVNTYTTLGSRGELFFTIFLLALTQAQTQSQTGGITDMYLRFGTLAKSFTTVMMQPSSVKIGMMGDINRRLHHKIKWSNTVPAILHETIKK